MKSYFFYYICAGVMLTLQVISCSSVVEEKEFNLDNTHVKWSGDTFGLSATLSEEANLFLQSVDNKAQKMLLEALNDEQRFVVAHVILTLSQLKEFQVDGSSWNKLEVKLYSPGPNLVKIDIDSAQIENLREFWGKVLN